MSTEKVIGSGGGRDSQIKCQCQRLGELIPRLRSEFQALEERLKPVLISAPPETEPEKADKESLCEIAEVLREVADALVSQATDISTLRECIEV